MVYNSSNSLLSLAILLSYSSQMLSTMLSMESSPSKESVRCLMNFFNASSAQYPFVFVLYAFHASFSASLFPSSIVIPDLMVLALAHFSCSIYLMFKGRDFALPVRFVTSRYPFSPARRYKTASQSPRDAACGTRCNTWRSPESAAYRNTP